MTTDQLRTLRERLHLHEEVPEESLADDKEPPYITLPPDSEAYAYLMQRRQALDGSLPSRTHRPKPPREATAATGHQARAAGDRQRTQSPTPPSTRPRQPQ